MGDAKAPQTFYQRFAPLIAIAIVVLVGVVAGLVLFHPWSQPLTFEAGSDIDGGTITIPKDSLYAYTFQLAPACGEVAFQIIDAAGNDGEQIPDPIVHQAYWHAGKWMVTLRGRYAPYTPPRDCSWHITFTQVSPSPQPSL